MASSVNNFRRLQEEWRWLNVNPPEVGTGNYEEFIERFNRGLSLNDSPFMRVGRTNLEEINNPNSMEITIREHSIRQAEQHYFELGTVPTETYKNASPPEVGEVVVGFNAIDMDYNPNARCDAIESDGRIYFNGWRSEPREDGVYGWNAYRGYILNPNKKFPMPDGTLENINIIEVFKQGDDGVVHCRPFPSGVTSFVSAEGEYNIAFMPQGRERTTKLYKFIGVADASAGAFYIGDCDGNEHAVTLLMVRWFRNHEVAVAYLNFLQNEEQIIQQQREEALEVAGLDAGDYIEVDLIKCRQYNARTATRKKFGACSIPLDYKSIYKVQRVGSVVYKTLGALKKSVTITVEGGVVPSIYVNKITEEEYKAAIRQEVGAKLVTSMVKEMERQVLSCYDTLEQLATKLIHKTRERSGLMGKLHDLRNSAGQALDSLEDSIRDLKKNKQVEFAELNADNMVVTVTTKPLCIKKILYGGHSGADITKQYEAVGAFPLPMGVYELYINLITGEVSTLRITKYPWLSSSNHPHMSSYICWGSMKGEIARAAADLDLATIVDIFIASVEIAIEGSAFGSLSSTLIDLPMHTGDVAGGRTEPKEGWIPYKERKEIIPNQF